MKRLAFIILLILLLAGCSGLPESIQFLALPTPTSSPAPTPTAFGLPATFTPDLFAINTQAPTTTPATATPIINDTPRPTSTATVRPTITLERIDPSLFTPSANIFLSVQKSTNQIVWGSTCDGDRSIKFIVTINKPKRLRYVLLFIKLQDKYSFRNTEWGLGAIMNDNDQNVYFYTLKLEQIPSYIYFEDAWLQYQFVGSTAYQTVLGRSVISQDSVSVTHCKSLNP